MDNSQLMKDGAAGGDSNLRQVVHVPENGEDNNNVKEKVSIDHNKTLDMVVIMEGDRGVNHENRDGGINNTFYDEDEEYFVDNYKELQLQWSLANFDENIFNDFYLNSIDPEVWNDCGLEYTTADDDAEKAIEQALIEEWLKFIIMDVANVGHYGKFNNDFFEAVEKLGDAKSSLEATDSVQEDTETFEMLTKKQSLTSVKRNRQDGSSNQQDGLEDPDVSAAKKARMRAGYPSPNEPKAVYI